MISSLFMLAAFQTYKGAPLYAPDPEIVLKGKRRTDAEHDEIYQKTQFPYVLQLERGDGRLTFVGPQHTYDPADLQLKKIEELWDEAKPDVALVESRVTDYSGKPDEAAKRGEPYFVLVLARKNNVDVYSLEPEATVEGAALAKAESPGRALLFLTLRGYMSNRRTRGEVADGLVQFMIARRAKEYGLECGLKTVADMDAMWRKDFPDLPDWRKIDERATWPGEERTYLNRLSNVANAVRDNHWAKTIVDLVRKGKRVFAVGGASHTIILEPVLRETLKEP
jgi:hypothetical protein